MKIIVYTCNTISGYSIMFHFYSEQPAFLAQYISLSLCRRRLFFPSSLFHTFFQTFANRKMVPIEMEKYHCWIKMSMHSACDLQKFRVSNKSSSTIRDYWLLLLQHSPFKYTFGLVWWHLNRINVNKNEWMNDRKQKKNDSRIHNLRWSVCTLSKWLLYSHSIYMRPLPTCMVFLHWLFQTLCQFLPLAASCVRLFRVFLSATAAAAGFDRRCAAIKYAICAIIFGRS